MKTGWEYKKLGEICDKGSSNISLNKIEDNIGEYALFGASGYVKGIDFYHNENPYIGIVKDGSGCGRVNIYPAKSSLVGTMQYIYPKQNCDIKFLMYLLQSLDLSSLVTGAAIPHIYFKDYSKFSIPVPPLPTQQSIVSELDSLSQIIADCKETLKDYDALEQSIFYDMFGDPVKNDKGWECVTINDIVRKQKNAIKRGPFGGALKKEIFVETGILVYEQFHALNNDFSFERYYISEEKYEEMKDFEVMPGDIIISCSGINLGRMSIIPNNAKKGIINQALLKLSIDNNIMTNKMFEFIFTNEYFKSKYFGDSRGCAIPNFPPMSEFKRFEFILPPLPLQQTFASKIEAIEQMKAETKAALQETETLFQARMDYWFN